MVVEQVDREDEGETVELQERGLEARRCVVLALSILLYALRRKCRKLL